VPENMRRDPPVNVSSVRDNAHDALERAKAHPKFVMDGEMAFTERLDTRDERNYPTLRPGAVGSAFANQTSETKLAAGTTVPPIPRMLTRRQVASD